MAPTTACGLSEDFARGVDGLAGSWMFSVALLTAAKSIVSVSGSVYADELTATATVIGTGSSPSWSAATRNDVYLPLAPVGREYVQNLWSFVRVVTNAPFTGLP